MPDPVIEKINHLPPLREVIRKAGLDAKKSLGQNFLLDLNLTGRIARAAPTLDGTVIEVGPGPGGLTRALLLAGAEHVIAIEKDRRAIAALKPLVDAAEGRLEIIEEDALKLDVASLGPRNKSRQIVANLPYNIATGLLLNWLGQGESLTSMTLMFQREVGQRLAAGPGEDAYGRLSVMAQWRCHVKRLFDIPPEAFVPPPKVTSSVVQLIPRPVPLAPAEVNILEEVTRVLFGQRRKMLRASSKPIGGIDLLEQVGIAGDVRAETLQVEDFCRIAEALRKVRA
ncbi:16S rRNA (adenine(1518)-N(6)/adenine(1519)-N(6))-dimethyltransferase RsmA [Alphaproteobacteria bacterium LSUCC0684]